MEYFILELDKNYTAPMIKNGIEKLASKGIHELEMKTMWRHTTFQIKQNMQTMFTDVIFFPIFMVSEEAKNVIALYEPHLHFIRVILTDKENKVSRRYYIPTLEEVDCLSPGSSLNVDRSVVYSLSIKDTMVKGKKIFRVGGLNCRCILVRIDLVESMLRRKLIGIGLREITMDYAQEQEESVNERK